MNTAQSKNPTVKEKVEELLNNEQLHEDILSSKSHMKQLLPLLRSIQLKTTNIPIQFIVKCIDIS